MTLTFFYIYIFHFTHFCPTLWSRLHLHWSYLAGSYQCKYVYFPTHPWWSWSSSQVTLNERESCTSCRSVTWHFCKMLSYCFWFFFFLDHAELQNRHSDKRWQCSVLELLVPLTLLSRKRRMQPSCPSSVAALDKRAWRGEGGSNNEVSALHSSSSSHCLHCHGNNQNCCRGNRLFISKIVSSCPKLNCR